MTQSSKYDLHDHLTLILFPLFSNLLSPYHLHGSKSIGMLQNHWKRSRCWEKLKAGEGDNRGWDGWMASLTRWTGVWASSGSWWWTGKPGVLQSMGSQRVRHDWETELKACSTIKKKKKSSSISTSAPSITFSILPFKESSPKRCKY